jgi:sugar/nucleoside kinase (ribokinase family)
VPEHGQSAGKIDQYLAGGARTPIAIVFAELGPCVVLASAVGSSPYPISLARRVSIDFPAGEEAGFFPIRET